MFARLFSFFRGHTAIAIVAGAFVIVAACGGALWIVYATGQQLISSVERDASAGELDLYAEMRREEGPETMVRAIARHARVEGEHHVYAVADKDGVILAPEGAVSRRSYLPRTARLHAADDHRPGAGLEDLAGSDFAFRGGPEIRRAGRGCNLHRL